MVLNRICVFWGPTGDEFRISGSRLGSYGSDVLDV